MSITMGQLATRFMQAAGKVPALTDQELRKFSQVGVGHVKRSIQDYHAVDTGTMLNSTTAEKSGKAYLIGPTVDYATYVALGTSGRTARPFHKKAANRLAKDLKDFGVTPKKLGL